MDNMKSLDICKDAAMTVRMMTGEKGRVEENGEGGLKEYES